MAEQNEVKHVEIRTLLSTYCPFCKSSFNTDPTDKKFSFFKAVYKGQEINIIRNRRLEIFEIDESQPLDKDEKLDDLICPHCNKSLIKPGVSCETCGSKAAEIIISAETKLIPFFICLKNNCEWHGVSKADEKKLLTRIPRQVMLQQDPFLRIHNFNEVPFGYTPEQAVIESNRCIRCKIPKCIEGCPVNIDIPAFIKLINEKKFDEAAKKIKERNVLPSICGRVCPQESQCEEKCVIGVKDRPVGIGNLERFVADYEREMNLVKVPFIKNKNNKKIAVIGSGPSGLTLAADMQLLGYSVTIFEALHETGGVLTYGIPEFRLPKSIVQFEINYLIGLGIRIELNHVIGNIITIEELLHNFNAVFIAVGAGLPWFMEIEGENAGNIFSANEYLTRMNLMKAYKFPEYDTPKPRGNKVAVIGGGNVAMDCARMALRTGSNEVTIVYRRSRTELPARIEEVERAEEEGIKFQLLTSPVKYLATEKKLVKGLECIKMELGEPDSSGRKRPIPIEGSNFVIDCDLAVVAIGTGPNPIIFKSTPELKRNKRGYIEVNPRTNETSIPLVYAGGDIVTGSATVILAMGAGRIAANAMHKKLSEMR